MRYVLHVLQGIGGRALRRYTGLRFRATPPRRADDREALEMFDYGASDDPC